MNSWFNTSAGWLTPRRIRAHALILALCLWGVCIVDYAKTGLFDRGGNIKFQDFLQFPISAQLMAKGRANDLYHDQVLAQEIKKISGTTRVELRYFYGPQVALPFLLLARFSFLTQAEIWVGLSLLIYFGCVHVVLSSCPALAGKRQLAVLCAIAYPPLFHFFVRGQLSAVALLFITAAYVALRAHREWLSGIALGFLIFKPQFLVAIPLVLLFAEAWRIFAGLVISAIAQLTLTYVYFGRGVMRAYFAMLLHSASQPTSTELRLSATQMHSSYSFLELLIRWPPAVNILYLLSSIAIIALATSIWKSSSSLAIRFSALLLSAVLVNPHIYIYDLLALAPMFLLLADWSVENAHHPETPPLRVWLYLAFLLPLFGPLARWTRLQLSVVVFLALVWTLSRISAHDREAVSVEGDLRKTGGK
jgi:hypothetical protein